jgi:hypothetical protein
MTVPAGVAAAASAQSIKPNIANSAPINLCSITLNPASIGAFELGKRVYRS